MYGVPLVLYKAGTGGVVHKIIGADLYNLVLAAEGVIKMEALPPKRDWQGVWYVA